MKQYRLKWPSNFDDYSWELESKGWFAGLEILVDGKTLTPVFYDPVRLSQSVADDVGRTGLFSEHYLIVISTVNRAFMERAIDDLAKADKL